MRSLVLLVLVQESLSTAIFDGDRVYRVVPSDVSHVQFLHEMSHGELQGDRAHLLSQVDAWSHPFVGEPVSIRVPSAVQNAFESEMRSRNIDHNVIIDNLEAVFAEEWKRDVRQYSLPPADSNSKYDQELLASLKNDRWAEPRSNDLLGVVHNDSVLPPGNIEQPGAGDAPPKSCVEGDGRCCEQYLSYEEIVHWMKDMAKRYHFVKLIEVGKSHENRMIYAIEIDAYPDRDKPRVVLDGGIHAREWASPAVVMWLGRHLLESYGNKKDVSRFLETATWILSPVFNPDGYEYTRSDDRLWRKNRQENSGSSCNGTDLCRNTDAGWGGPGSSGNPCDGTYRGPSAFSAPETQAFRTFYTSVPNFKLYINFHAYSQLWLMPYGYTREKMADHDEVMKVSELVKTAIFEAEGHSYRVGPAATTIYPASGIMHDWAYDSLGVKFSFAVELRPKLHDSPGFSLPAGEICSMGREVLAGLKVLVARVDREWRGL